MNEKQEKSAAEIRDELIGEMAAILYDIAPPYGQLIIDRLMKQLNDAVQRDIKNWLNRECVKCGTKWHDDGEIGCPKCERGKVG